MRQQNKNIRSNTHFYSVSFVLYIHHLKNAGKVQIHHKNENGIRNVISRDWKWETSSQSSVKSSLNCLDQTVNKHCGMRSS